MKVEYTVFEVNQLLIFSDTAFCVPVYILLIPYDFQICCAQIFSKNNYFNLTYYVLFYMHLFSSVQNWNVLRNYMFTSSF